MLRDIREKVLNPGRTDNAVEIKVRECNEAWLRRSTDRGFADLDVHLGGSMD